MTPHQPHRFVVVCNKLGRARERGTLSGFSFFPQRCLTFIYFSSPGACPDTRSIRHFVYFYYDTRSNAPIIFYRTCAMNNLCFVTTPHCKQLLCKLNGLLGIFTAVTLFYSFLWMEKIREGCSFMRYFILYVRKGKFDQFLITLLIKNVNFDKFWYGDSFNPKEGHRL